MTDMVFYHLQKDKDVIKVTKTNASSSSLNSEFIIY